MPSIRVDLKATEGVDLSTHDGAVQMVQGDGEIGPVGPCIARDVVGLNDIDGGGDIGDGWIGGDDATHNVQRLIVESHYKVLLAYVVWDVGEFFPCSIGNLSNTGGCRAKCRN